MLYLIINSFYFLLPAAFANMAPVFFKKLNFLNQPIDFNIKLKGKRLLGKNKSWRGFLAGILLAIIIIIIQKYLYNINFFQKISIINYNQTNIFLLGGLLGLGAMLGDLIESGIKRRMNIKPGQRFLFWDQTDWVIGSLMITTIYTKISIKIVVTSIILFFILHLIVKRVGFYLKLEEKKW